MKNKLAAVAAILLIGLLPQLSNALTIEQFPQREGLPANDPMLMKNKRADNAALTAMSVKHGFLDFSTAIDERCFGGRTCEKLLMYFDDPITPEILRKINDMKSEIYYNYYKKYGSQIFFVSITMFHYPKKFDIKTQNSNPNQAVYISVLSFARFNQVSINSVAEAKRLLPMIWHTEFIHPMFKFARNNK